MINVSREGGVLTITLDRPDKANALTQGMMETVRDTVLEASEQAIILSGTGKVFCAGMDLDAAKTGLPTAPIWEELSGAIARSDALTIAALNGTLAGGAFGMALACDLRIAVPTAKFFYPVMKLGFLPQPSDPLRLTGLVGPAAAKRVLMAGEKLVAEDALRIGLIDHVVPPDQLLAKAYELTNDAIAADPSHVAAIKSMIRL